MQQGKDGGTEAAIVRMAKAARQPLPERIAQAPELRPELGLFYTAFFDLHTTRQIGFAEGPISWLAINEYCMYHQIVGEQREDFEYHLAKMDAVYLDYVSKKRSTGNGKRPKVSG